MKTVTISVSDAQAGSLAFYKAESGTIVADRAFDAIRSDGRGESVSVSATLQQLVTAGAITGTERTTLLALLVKVNAGLRTMAQLDPA